MSRRPADRAAGAPPERRWEAALREVEASIERAWEEAFEAADVEPMALARRVLEDPAAHEWRLVDAALGRLLCEECGSRLGSGPRGCGSCDMADGLRFAGREPDRPGVPPGNEHAIRVSTAVLRAPHRYPEWTVAGNRLFLPLFLAGLMPTRPQQLALKAASDRGPLDLERLERATRFGELADVALAGTRARQAGGGPDNPR